MKTSLTALILTTALAFGAHAEMFYRDIAPAAGVPSPTAEIPTIAAAMPKVEQQGSVNFVTGGVGDDERMAIESARASYNLHVMSASANGAFVGDTEIVVHAKSGDEVLHTTAGPLLYAQLPPGSYVLTALKDNEQKRQRFVITKKSPVANIHLTWKEVAEVSDE